MFNRQSLHIALLLWGYIFSLIAALCISTNKNFDKEKRRWLLCQQLTCSVLLLSDALAWGYRGYPGLAGSLVVHISNFLVFAFSDVILLLFHGYLCCYLFPGSQVRLRLSGNSKNEIPGKDQPVIRIRAVTVIAILALLLVILSQFTHLYYYIDARNIYHRNSGYIISLFLPLAGMLTDLSLLIQYRKKISLKILVAMLSYIVLPMVAAIMLIFYYGISLVNLAISISMILMFIEMTIEQGQLAARREREMAEQALRLARTERELAEQKWKLAQTERELTDSRIASMMSQIRNHFIFNVLGTISTYCKIDPNKADEALTKFARYLRRNINYLETTEMVIFENEIAQIEDYVALEQMRFGERIQFEENFETMNFKIPPLTVQPLVENAIKHGLTKPGRKGTVCVLTRQEKDGIIIEVTDNGIGFHTEDLEKNGSVGIKNIRYRLEHMAGATLQIESKPEEGTKATIRIPVQQEKEQ